jgi:hypothetical protein
MYKFLRFPSYVINTKYITKIYKNKNSYEIIMPYNSFTGINIFTFGWISNESNNITVDKDIHPIEYKIIDDFIKSLD